MKSALLTAVLLSLASHTSASQIDLSLNLIYDAPFNPNSGGVWQVVAKNDASGVAWLAFRLTGARLATSQLAAPQGIVNDHDTAGFVSSVRNFASPLPNTDYLAQRDHSITPGDQMGVFYGVGSLENGSPGDLGPDYSTLSSTTGAPWATGDFLGDADWDTAAVFFTGTFLPGDAPQFFLNAADDIQPIGAEYTSVAGATPTSAAISTTALVTTTVRDNLQGIAGDYNQDGVVDSADYSVWRDTLGQAVGLAGQGADGNANGNVDQADYELWRNAYRQVSTAPSVAGLAIPSPNSLLLGLVGLLFTHLRIGTPGPRGYCRDES